MSRCARLFICGAMMIAVLIAPPDTARGQATAITKSGRTLINRELGTRAVHVTIDTIEVDNGSVGFPKVEYLAGVKSVTLVQKLEISIDRNSLFVPRSVFADLLNPGRASVEFSNGTFILTITGADGAESYFMRVYFDAAKVKRRALYSALTPNRPSEDTQYRFTVLKDE